MLFGVPHCRLSTLGDTYTKLETIRHDPMRIMSFQKILLALAAFAIFALTSAAAKALFRPVLDGESVLLDTSR